MPVKPDEDEPPPVPANTPAIRTKKVSSKTNFFLSKQGGLIHCNRKCCGMRYFSEVACQEASMEDEYCAACFGIEKVTMEDFVKQPARKLEDWSTNVDEATAGKNSFAMVALLRNAVEVLMSRPSVTFMAPSRCGSSSFSADIGNQHQVRSQVIKLLSAIDTSVIPEATMKSLAEMLKSFSSTHGDFESSARDGKQWKILAGLVSNLSGEVIDAPKAEIKYWEPTPDEWLRMLDAEDAEGVSGVIRVKADLKFSSVRFGAPPNFRNGTLVAEDLDKHQCRRRALITKIVLDAGAKLQLHGLELRVVGEIDVKAGATLQCYNCEIRGALRMRIEGENSTLMLKDCALNGLQKHGIECVKGGSLFCEGSSIEHCGGSGIYLDGFGKVNVRNSVVQGCEDSGIFVKDPISKPASFHWTTVRGNGKGKISYKRTRPPSKPGRKENPNAGEKPFRDIQPSPKDLASFLRVSAKQFRTLRKDADIEELRSALTQVRALNIGISEILDTPIIADINAAGKACPKVKELADEVVSALMERTRLDAYLDFPAVAGDEPPKLEDLAAPIQRLAGMDAKDFAPKDGSSGSRALARAGQAVRAIRARKPAPTAGELLRHNIAEVLEKAKHGTLAPFPSLISRLVAGEDHKTSILTARQLLAIRKAMDPRGLRPPTRLPDELVLGTLSEPSRPEGVKLPDEPGGSLLALKQLGNSPPPVEAMISSGIGSAVVRLAEKAKPPNRHEDPNKDVREACGAVLEAWLRPGPLAKFIYEAASGAPPLDVAAAVKSSRALLDAEKVPVLDPAECGRRQWEVANWQVALHAAMQMASDSPDMLSALIKEISVSGWLGKDGGMNTRLEREAAPPISGLAVAFKNDLKGFMRMTKEKVDKEQKSLAKGKKK